MRGLLAVLAVAFLPLRASAWGAAGHRTIAMIAEARLTPTALAAVHSIIGPKLHLSQLASCPDEIRGDRGANCGGMALPAMPESEPWHFIDMEISDADAAIDKYCPGSNPSSAPGDDPLIGHDCVVGQIYRQLKVLRDPVSSRSDKQVALMFLVHFVGDAHQPLHCADDNDRGGNQKPATWTADGSAPPAPVAPEVRPAAVKMLARPEGADQEKYPLNLHSLWDHIIGPKDSFDPIELSSRLGGGLGDKPEWLAGDFVRGAALESFAISRDVIYPAYAKDDGVIDAQYQKDMQAIAFQRLQMAGVRLAALLEQVLAAP